MGSRKHRRIGEEFKSIHQLYYRDAAKITGKTTVSELISHTCERDPVMARSASKRLARRPANWVGEDGDAFSFLGAAWKACTRALHRCCIEICIL